MRVRLSPAAPDIDKPLQTSQYLTVARKNTDQAIMSRQIIALFVFVLFVISSVLIFKNIQDDKNPPVIPLPPQIQASVPPYSDAANKEECDLKGGTWQKWGLAETEFCQIPVPDAGKACADGSQCSLGKCLTTDNTTGQCQTYRQTFGCLTYLEKGQPTGGICID